MFFYTKKVGIKKKIYDTLYIYNTHVHIFIKFCYNFTESNFNGLKMTFLIFFCIFSLTSYNCLLVFGCYTKYTGI